MAKKRLSLKELQAQQLNDAQQLQTKGGYLVRPNKFSTSKVHILEDDIDIREPKPYGGDDSDKVIGRIGL